MVDKIKILANLKSDMNAADNLRLETVSQVETWKNAYNGEKYGNEEKGKSALVSRDVKRQDEWQHASLKDPFLSSANIIKAIPITAEDRAAAEQTELVLNYQFTRKFNRYKFITDSVKLMTTEGTLVVKCSWDYEDEEVEVEYPIYELDPLSMQPVQTGIKLVKELKVLVNKPNAETCRIEDIYIDPTCHGDMEKCQFIIHRYETDLSTLRNSKKYKKKALDEVARNIAIDTGDYENEDDTNFIFKDKPRKKMIVHEYWGNYDINDTGIAKPIVCTWVNNTVIRLEDNPYPNQQIPFLVVAHNPIPFQMTGEANAETIGDNQKIATAVKRGVIDNMANSTNGQKGIRKGALDVLNRKRFLSNKNFEFNSSSADLFEGSYNNIPNSVFNLLELVNNETESITGVKGFAGGIGGAGLGSTARAAGGVLDAVSVRQLDIVRNISENLVKPLMRKWMSYNAVWLKDEEVIRVTNDDFATIKRDDLRGEVDIEIEVSTAENNASKSRELAFLLQTNGPNEDPGIRNILTSHIMKLHNMPDVAKMIEDYKPPEPNPYVLKMQSLEMRKLEAEINERESRAKENAVDMRLKTANAVLAEAKARLVNSDTDIKDLDFMKKATGEDLEDELTKKDHDRLTQLDLKSVDSLQRN